MHSFIVAVLLVFGASGAAAQVSATQDEDSRRYSFPPLECGVFHEGLMIAPTDEWFHAQDGRRFVYVDASGRDSLGKSFQTCYRFREGVALVDDGEWKLMDRSGEYLGELPSWLHPVAHSAVQEGLLAVRSGVRWGYVNRHAELVIELQFESARAFSEGRAAVRKEGKWGFIDRTGASRIAFQYDGAQEFFEGVAPVCAGDRWGCINHHGELVAKPVFDHVRTSSEGIIAAQLDGKWGAIDHKGNTVLPIIYEEIGDCHEGVVRAKVKDLWGFVDHQGTPIIPFQFIEARDFSEGVAVVRRRDRIYAYVSKAGEYGIIEQPRVLSPQDIRVPPEWEGRTTVEQALKLYPPEYVEAFQKTAWKAKYGWISDFSEGLATIVERETGKVWIVDRRGKKLSAVEWKSNNQ